MGTLRRQRSAASSIKVEELAIEDPSRPKLDLKEESSESKISSVKDEVSSSTSNSPTLSATNMKSSPSPSDSTPVSKMVTDTTKMEASQNHVNGHASVKAEPPTPANDTRSTSRKGVARVAPLFDHLPDATLEAKSAYQTLDACTYANKYLGFTEHAMECDCSEEWGKLYQLPLALIIASDDEPFH